MSKAESIGYTCQICGWTIKTPFGREDLEACVICHNEKHHNKVMRMTKAELIDKIAKNTKLTKK